MPPKPAESQPNKDSSEGNRKSSTNSSQDHNSMEQTHTNQSGIQTSQSKGSSQVHGQSQPPSQTEKQKTTVGDNNSESPARLEPVSKDDMQTEEELMKALESDEDDIPIMHHKKDFTAKHILGINNTGNESLKLHSEITLESDKNIAETMDLQESDDLNLCLDMSVTETTGAIESDINLQLDVSVHETEEKNLCVDKASKENGKTDSMALDDVESDSTSKPLNLQLDSSTDYSSEDNIKRGSKKPDLKTDLNLQLDVSTDDLSSEDNTRKKSKNFDRKMDLDSESTSKNLNLQLDVSTEEHSSDENVGKNQDKFTSAMDIESESASKSLNLQLDVSTDEHSSEERNSEQDAQKITNNTMDVDSESMSIL